MLESLEPNGTLDRVGTEQEDFSLLHEWLLDNEASYTIYFLDTPLENYIFISYVPDTSNVTSPIPPPYPARFLLRRLMYMSIGPLKDVIRIQSSDINLNARSPRSTSRPSNYRDLKIRPDFPFLKQRTPFPLRPLHPRKGDRRDQSCRSRGCTWYEQED